MKVLAIPQDVFEAIDFTFAQDKSAGFRAIQHADNDWCCSIPNRNNLVYLGIMIDLNGVTKSLNQILNELLEVTYIPIENAG